MPISSDTQRFIERYVDSVERLEILLLLRGGADREWTASQVASELRLSQADIDRQLAKLCAFSLLDVRVATDLYYRYRPRLPHLEQGVDRLAAAYADDRFGVLRCVTARPPSPMRDFAEAFRLVKKEGDDD